MHAVCMHAIMADSRHSVMQKQLLLKKQIHTDGIAVSTNHMSSYNHDNVCKKCASTSLHLCQMTCKVFGIIYSVINALLPASIFWEIKQNQTHQSRNNIIPLIECLPLDLPTTPKCFFCEKTRSQRCWQQNWTNWTVFVLEKHNNTWQQTESQAKIMCLDRRHRLVRNNDIFAAESKQNPSRFRYLRAAFSSHNSKCWRAK